MIAFLIQSNYNINFIPSSIKVLAFIHYITNYATKANCSQYQRVMATVMVRKTFENLDIKSGPDNIPLRLNKFVLNAFN